jgi:uncharacterized protein (DUF433 family)
MMSILDWSKCPAVESVPDRRSGEWVLRNTRMPVATIFDNLQDLSADEVADVFGVSKEQIVELLTFVSQSLEQPDLDALTPHAYANSV